MKIMLSALAALAITVVQVRAADGENAKSAAKTTGANSVSSASPELSELAALEARIEEQQQQIEQLQKTIQEQHRAIERLSQTLTAKAPAGTPRSTAEIASAAPSGAQQPASANAVAASTATPPAGPAPQAELPESPLQLRIGNSAITPVGFMDITNTWRSTNAGTSLQTNFGSFPYNNVVAGRLSEDKWSGENSRLGFRVDTTVKGANVLGYFEGDFVGGVTGNNTQVSSNSMLFRIRQYYVDVRKGFWEVLAGQAWSLITPNRRGMSPLPADLFYSQVVDVNYTNGLYWGRIPGIRFIGHPSNKFTFGLALENSTQYLGGSGGGGVPLLPTALATAYNGEVDNGATNDRNLPNVHPDILGKIVYEPTRRLHLEMGGLETTVKTFNPLTNQYFTKAGGAATFSINAEVVKNFRVVTNNFYGDGAGRYLFGAAPNFIVRADGSPSLVHAASTVSGFEATIKNFAPYIYYGGVYIDRNTAFDANGTTRIGYGYTGSANGQNRSIQEITGGWTHTFWRDGRYGALQWMAQYAYFFRNPWFVAPGTPKTAHETAIWFNLRYVLPGTPPSPR
jgi:hypothetical protein